MIKLFSIATKIINDGKITFLNKIKVIVGCKTYLNIKELIKLKAKIVFWSC